MTTPTIIKLQDGNVMPQLGLGVWKASEQKEVITAIHKALEVGYRSIDTSVQKRRRCRQSNTDAGVPREELFITTKLWNDDQKRPRKPCWKKAWRSSRLDYLICYLMHWPVPAIDHYVEAWENMIDLQKKGRLRASAWQLSDQPSPATDDETGVPAGE